jgi:hypothetical protein
MYMQVDSNISKERTESIFSPEDGSIMFVQNISFCLQVLTALLARRPTSTCGKQAVSSPPFQIRPPSLTL